MKLHSANYKGPGVSKKVGETHGHIRLNRAISQGFEIYISNRRGARPCDSFTPREILL